VFGRALVTTADCSSAPPTGVCATGVSTAVSGLTPSPSCTASRRRAAYARGTNPQADRATGGVAILPTDQGLVRRDDDESSAGRTGASAVAPASSPTRGAVSGHGASGARRTSGDDVGHAGSALCGRALSRSTGLTSPAASPGALASVGPLPAGVSSGGCTDGGVTAMRRRSDRHRPLSLARPPHAGASADAMGDPGPSSTRRKRSYGNGSGLGSSRSIVTPSITGRPERGGSSAITTSRAVSVCCPGIAPAQKQPSEVATSISTDSRVIRRSAISAAKSWPPNVSRRYGS
jgi:hypothetical protein